MSYKITSGLFLALESWIHDEDIHRRLFRVWFKNPKWDGRDPQYQYIDEKCDYYFFTEFVILPNGDVLIGISSYDDTAENLRHPSLSYYKLSKIHFDYLESGNDSDEEDET